MFTVLGASGFIGSHLVRWLRSQSIPWSAPSGAEAAGRGSLGDVICCVGLTADFRDRPFDTVRAHVSHLLDILEHAEFDSFLYLSSTRVYAGSDDSSEDAVLRLRPSLAGDLYNISKIMGESIALSSRRPNVRIVRLSNVYGSGFSSQSFLADVVREAVQRKRVVLRTSLASAKDYVHVDDVVRLLPRVATSGQHRTYNVASGVNTTNAELMRVIRDATGCEVDVAEDALTVVFPSITVGRIRQEFGWSPTPIPAALGGLIEAYRAQAGG